MEKNVENKAELNSSNSKMEIDSGKLENFLKKVQTKLNMKVEDIGKDNENTLTSWVREIKDKSDSGKMIVNYDYKLFQENINREQCETNKIESEVLINTHSLKDFFQRFEKLFDSKASMIEKQEMNDYFLQNFDKFNLSKDEYLEIESYFVKILNEETQWEILNACILLITIIVEKNFDHFDFKKFISAIRENFIKLIQHGEYRLRTSLTNLFKAICGLEGENYDLIGDIKYFIEKLVDDIIRNFQFDGEFDISTQNNNLQSTTSPNPTSTLDTSKNILKEIIKSFQSFKKTYNMFDQPTIEKFISYLDHSNKGVRLASYEILESIVNYYKDSQDQEEMILYLRTNFNEKVMNKVSISLVDFYPQVRFATLNFIQEFIRFILWDNKNANYLQDNFFKQEILPLICINRYLPVEGVKNISLSLWKEIVNLEGIKIIREEYKFFLKCYLNQMNSKSHLAREAACRCLQELVMKVYNNEDIFHAEITLKNRVSIVSSIEKCIKDACWNVRESALNASGFVFLNLKGNLNLSITKSENLMSFFELVKLHLFDNIFEVRDSAAFSIRVIISGFKSEEIKQFDDLANFNIFNYLKNLISEISSENLIELEKNFQILRNSIFEKVKSQTESVIQCNQTHNHNYLNTQCTLQPDLGFVREIDSWEYVDAIVHLIKELAEGEIALFQKISLDFYKTLNSVIDYISRNIKTLPNLLKKSIWSCLSSMFKKMKRGDIEFYIENILDSVVKEIESNLYIICFN